MMRPFITPNLNKGKTMTNDMMQMPDADEIREDLAAARIELEASIKEDEDLADRSIFVMELLGILEDKIQAGKNLSKLDRKEKISIMAHLNLFYALLDDLFGDDFEEFDDEDFEGIEFEDEDEK